MIAKIIVTPKKSVLDPQGEAVRHAIHTLGMECVESARIGKYIELNISGTNAELTRTKLDAICRDLLSNPVVEDYELLLEGAGAASSAPKKEKKEKDGGKKKTDKKRKDKEKAKKADKKK